MNYFRGRLLGASVGFAVLGLLVWFVVSAFGEDVLGGDTTPSPSPAASTAVTGAPSTPAAPPPAESPAAGGDATAAATTSGLGPDVVADAVAAAMVSVDTTVDAAPTAAIDRAAAWMTPELAAVLEDGAQGAGASWWEELSAHQGATTARVTTVEDSGQPADTATTAYRVRWVERVPTGAGGWEGEVYGQTLFLTMTRTDASAPWLVSDVTAG